MTQIQTKRTLYDQDMNAWFDLTIIQLKDKQFYSLDLEHLIEEIEGLSARDRRELESRLEVLLSHILKRIHLNSKNENRGWELTIREQRNQLKKILKQSPSLRNHLDRYFSEAWEIALSEVKEDYSNAQFPDQWEFTRDIDLLLTQKFW
jgi:Domain of unknown function DUF29